MNKCEQCFRCCNSLWRLHEEWKKNLTYEWLEIETDVVIMTINEPYTICPFFYIGYEKNYCIIYSHRPKFCRESVCHGFGKFPPV